MSEFSFEDLVNNSFGNLDLYLQDGKAVARLKIKEHSECVFDLTRKQITELRHKIEDLEDRLYRASIDALYSKFKDQKKEACWDCYFSRETGGNPHYCQEHYPGLVIEECCKS